MSQRYFLTAESTYEDLRASLNVALGYPNSLGKSVFQTALYAPRDSFRRVLLAVDTAIQGYATINAALMPLIDSDAVEEIDEATYLAAVASAAQGGGASSWNDLADKPSTFSPSAHKSSHATGGADALTAADIGAAAASHTHALSSLTQSGATTGQVAQWNGSAWAAATPSASVTYATTAQAADLTATAVAMNPANVRTAISATYRVAYQTNFTANGGSVATNNNVNIANLSSNATANGAAVTYISTQWSTRGRQSFDFSRPVAFRIVFIRQQCPSTGVFRVLFGGLANAFSWTTLDRRGFGFEVRQSRIWLLAHNGTSLTSVDTGIDGPTTDFGNDASEVWIRSDGTGNVTLTHSLNGGSVSTFTTTGGPSTTLSENPNAWAGVNNGGTASNAQFVFQPHLLVLS